MVPGEWVPERTVVVGHSHFWNPGLKHEGNRSLSSYPLIF